MSESRNQAALDVIVAYCIDHPDQRFWQALRNVSSFTAILGEKNGKTFDTWHYEGLSGFSETLPACEWCHDGQWPQAYLTHSVNTVTTFPPQFECYYCKKELPSG